MANMSNIDKVIGNHYNTIESIVAKFCKKQGFEKFGFVIGSDDKVVIFDNDLMMLFNDIAFDLIFDIEKGVAAMYMLGFDMNLDDAKIGKEISYQEYLKSKKLI